MTLLPDVLFLITGLSCLLVAWHEVPRFLRDFQDLRAQAGGPAPMVTVRLKGRETDRPFPAGAVIPLGRVRPAEAPLPWQDGLRAAA